MYDFISRAIFKDLRERSRLKVRSFASSTFGNILKWGFFQYQSQDQCSI